MPTTTIRAPRPRTLVLIGAAYGFVAAASLPIFPYAWHLVLHVLGAVLFLGNLIVSAAWVVSADLARDRRALRFAARTVSRADAVFTAPGALLLLANGLAMSAHRWSSVPAFLSEVWVSASLMLFGLSGVVWVLLLVPRQIALARLAVDFGDGGGTDAEIRRTLRSWYGWGTLATALPLAALVLMILKPTFG